MKKILSVALAVVMMLTLSVSVMAASVEFVPSVTNKGAPKIVTTQDDNGRNVIGFVRDANNKVLTTEYEDCIVITPISEAETSTEIPTDSKETLLSVYNELNKEDSKLSEVCPELNDVVAKELGEGKTADDLVIRDLFDISEICGEMQTHLPVEGNYIDLTFDLSLASDTFIVAMVYVDGEWKLVPKTVNNGDGTITCSFEEVCPVAFLVPADVEADTEAEVPVTGDSSQSNLILWIVVMAISLTAIAVLAVIYFKKKKQ